MSAGTYRTMTLPERIRWFRSAQSKMSDLLRRLISIERVERAKLAASESHNSAGVESSQALTGLASDVMALRDFLLRGVQSLTVAYNEYPHVPVVQVQPSLGHTSFKLTANHEASSRGRIEATGTANYSAESVTGPFWPFLAGDMIRISGSKTAGNNGLWVVHARVNGQILELTSVLSSSETSDPGVTVELYQRTFTTP